MIGTTVELASCNTLLTSPSITRRARLGTKHAPFVCSPIIIFQIMCYPAQSNITDFAGARNRIRNLAHSRLRYSRFIIIIIFCKLIYICKIYISSFTTVSSLICYANYANTIWYLYFYKTCGFCFYFKNGQKNVKNIMFSVEQKDIHIMEIDKYCNT